MRRPVQQAAETPVTPEASGRPPQQRDAAARQSRRRPNRRRVVPEVVSTEVLRRDTGRQAPVVPERKRPIADEFDASEPRFGCPMLTRTRLGMPFRGGTHAPRCSVGWSVHDEDEAFLCMHTPTRNDCWKEHPERLAKLLEELEIDDAVSAAD